jgi:hypothetical protein
MLKNSTNGGYVWLFMLFIGIALIVVFVIQGGYIAGSEKDGNFFDKATGAIDGAKKAKEQMEGYKFDPEVEERSIDDMN